MPRLLKIDNCGECPHVVISKNSEISNYCQNHSKRTIDEDLSIPWLL